MDRASGRGIGDGAGELTQRDSHNDAVAQGVDDVRRFTVQDRLRECDLAVPVLKKVLLPRLDQAIEV